MANPTYVAQLQELKAKLAADHTARVAAMTATLNKQYNAQIEFINAIIAKNS